MPEKLPKSLYYLLSILIFLSAVLMVMLIFQAPMNKMLHEYRTGNTRSSTLASQSAATVKKGEIVFSFPILHPKRQVAFVSKGTEINPVTGEESTCSLGNKARLEVIGSSENQALLIVLENTASGNYGCYGGQEILVSVDDVAEWKIAEALERNEKAVSEQKRAQNLALLKAIKAESQPR